MNWDGRDVSWVTSAQAHVMTPPTAWSAWLLDTCPHLEALGAPLRYRA